MFQHFQLRALQRVFEAIGEADEKAFSCHRRRARHHAHRAARMHEGIVRAAHFHQRNHLRSGKDVVRLMGHLLFPIVQ